MLKGFKEMRKSEYTYLVVLVKKSIIERFASVVVVCNNGCR